MRVPPTTKTTPGGLDGEEALGHAPGYDLRADEHTEIPDGAVLGEKTPARNNI